MIEGRNAFAPTLCFAQFSACNKDNDIDNDNDDDDDDDNNNNNNNNNNR